MADKKPPKKDFKESKGEKPESEGAPMLEGEGIPIPEGEPMPEGEQGSPNMKEVIAKLMMDKQHIPGTQGSNPAPMMSSEQSEMPQNPNDMNMIAMLLQQILERLGGSQAPQMPPQGEGMPMPPMQGGGR